MLINDYHYTTDELGKLYAHARSTAPEKDRKDVAGKPLPLLMPYEALVAYSKVSDYGNAKYGNRDSWKHATHEEGFDRYSNAAVRHLYSIQNGTEDQESHLPHIYQALWNICAAVWHYERMNERAPVDPPF